MTFSNAFVSAQMLTFWFKLYHRRLTLWVKLTMKNKLQKLTYAVNSTKVNTVRWHVYMPPDFNELNDYRRGQRRQRINLTIICWGCNELTPLPKSNLLRSWSLNLIIKRNHQFNVPRLKKENVTEAIKWINDYILILMRDVITQPSPNFSKRHSSMSR